MSLAKRIRARRQDLGITAQSVAKTLGVAHSTYFDWEQGRGISGESHYLPLCQILGMSLSELITGSKQEIEIENRLDKIERQIKMIRSCL